MFTGLIQALGTVQLLGANKLQISCVSEDYRSILQDLTIGDSVAVDGICLTVVEILNKGFVAIASPETLRRTTLGHKLQAKELVNLETCLRAGSKLGGHFVTGHVDGIGYFKESVQTANSWEMTFSVPSQQIARYIVPKGSIAVNGISLTIAECEPAGFWFKVAVIPHTYKNTNLHTLHPGSLVNLEADILGKYVEKFLRFRSGYFAEAHTREETASLGAWDNITPAFLAEHGYL
ncbi:MAG: riboflavin synthase [Oscillatoriaceae bacterium SKW80]|nr:riboflavin synthase [Oscillatoriaceae bacterium SKYG93]MCX8119549.1 riboflavin synthase [Oscillatoriaceae bacterium SKW80]MDW8455015.1 riboflavin synthase [Oscillatoriaceae cyanobacterium SKYGB_i_bin93]HIK28208.1 riboflavin synthase [Oscillatoriaceae cyanobacterium M7585_C2015_266]